MPQRPPKKKIRLQPDFLDTIAETGLSVAEFSRRADVAPETIWALLNPNRHPERRGGMRRETAFKLITTLAKELNIDREEARRRTTYEEEIAEGTENPEHDHEAA